jgi:signal transduction protein with GAF and PtsI domain
MTRLRTTRIVTALAVGVGCVALAFQSVAATSVDPAPTQEDAAQEQEEEHGPLHEAMEQLQGGMKSLRKMLNKPEEKEKALELVRKMQGATLIGFQNPPELEEGLEGTAAVERHADFKKRMLSVCSTLVDLEIALEKEDADEAKNLYRALGKQKKEGHDSYL